MKYIYNSVLFFLFISSALLSCSKDTSELPPKIVYPEVLNGTWTSNQFEGIVGDTLTFTISSSISGSVINKFVGFNGISKPGDIYMSDESPLITGDFYCILRYYFVSGNTIYGYPRNATISLQNNNTQMTVALLDDGPGYPAVTYVYQKVK
jgi:hypothetical protein